jgi:hypothetical protein
MKINRIIMAAVGGLVLSGTAMSASAASISYSAVGRFFDSGTSSFDLSSITFGSATLTFNDLGTALVAGNTVSTNIVNPTNANFGSFSLTDIGTNSISNEGFQLSIYQFNPATITSSPQVLPEVLSGTITATSSGLELHFTAGNSVTFLGAPGNPNVNYTVFTDSNGDVNISPPNENLGLTTVQGQIGSFTVPLPASAMGGLTLVGLVFANEIRRRRCMA